MTSLTPAKIGRLRALLKSLPEPAAERLVDAAAGTDPTLARLLDFCALDPEDAARERFFAPLAPLSGDPAETRPSLAYAPPAILAALWSWIAEDLDPEAAEAARAASAVFDDAEPGQLDELRVRVSGRIIDAIEATEHDPKGEKRLKHRLAVRDFKSVLDIAVILRTAPVLRGALEGLPQVIEEISDALSADLRDRYERAGEEDPDAGAWFLYFVMARLTRPWRILRAFERIAKRGDDFLLSRTDMAGIGEALLLDAEHHLAGFSRSPATLAEARAAVRALADFSAVTVGMTREIGIRKDGAWGQKLVALRNQAAGQMERIHTRARKIFDPLLAESRSGRAAQLNPVPGRDTPHFAEALALGVFLTESAADASRAAVAGAHQQLLADLRGGLEELGRHLLAQLRGEDARLAETARVRLEDTARLMIVLGEKEAAQILLRRTAAAKAA